MVMVNTEANKSYLIVEVIKVARDKNMYVSHDLQNVQSLMRTHRVIQLINHSSTLHLHLKTVNTQTCSRVWLGRCASVIVSP